MPTLPADWAAAIGGRLPDTSALSAFLRGEQAAGKSIFPAEADWFRALELTPPDRVRVVILGQDPYPTAGRAHGLAFSMLPGNAVRHSLAHIYRELQTDLGIEPAGHTVLDHWARQGVLLLNTILTVEEGKPLSHKGRGWEEVTDAIISAVSDRVEPVVFMLWGGPAQRKANLIDRRHLVLNAPHPSPMSARLGFFGCRHFSRANAFLEARGQPPIDWRLPETP